MLDTFYTQFGSLTSLEFLNIRSAGTHHATEVADGGLITEVLFRKACLPGLLALEDESTGQLGFLPRWVSLKGCQSSAGHTCGRTQMLWRGLVSAKSSGL